MGQSLFESTILRPKCYPQNMLFSLRNPSLFIQEGNVFTLHLPAFSYQFAFYIMILLVNDLKSASRAFPALIHTACREFLSEKIHHVSDNEQPVVNALKVGSCPLGVLVAKSKTTLTLGLSSLHAERENGLCHQYHLGGLRLACMHRQAGKFSLLSSPSVPGNLAESSNENPGLRAITSNIEPKKV
jgi:hypothetical protein